MPLTSALQRYPAFVANDLDHLDADLRVHLGAKVITATILDRPFQAEANHADLAQSEFWFCSYDTPLQLKFPEGDFIRLQIPRRGKAATSVGDQQVAVAGRQGCVSTAAATIDFGEDFRQLVWRVPMPALVNKLSMLLDHPLTASLCFDPVFDFGHGFGQSVQPIVEMMLSTLEAAPSPARTLLITEIEQALIVAFLCGAEHPYRDALSGEKPQIAPWQVRRAEAYIEANWTSPVDIDQLVAVTGASARTIFRTFQSSRGYSPTQFARKIRLEQARAKIEAATPATTLTMIAQDCGWCDLSRFSKDYAAAYGEPPSAALSRGRRRN